MQITHNRERPGGMRVIPGAMMLDLRLEELESHQLRSIACLVTHTV